MSDQTTYRSELTKARKCKNPARKHKVEFLDDGTSKIALKGLCGNVFITKPVVLTKKNFHDFFHPKSNV